MLGLELTQSTVVLVKSLLTIVLILGAFYLGALIRHIMLPPPQPLSIPKQFVCRAACETPGAFGLAQSSILLVNTHSPWIADWMPALEDRRHAERWK